MTAILERQHVQIPTHKPERSCVAGLHILGVLGYPIFFLLSAQRFFIARDIAFELPASFLHGVGP